MEKLCKNCRYYLILYQTYKDIHNKTVKLKGLGSNNRCLKEKGWFTVDDYGCDMFKSRGGK